MSDSNFTIPFEYVNPRCFILKSVFDKSQALVQAGNHQSSVFGWSSRVPLFDRRNEATLLNRRLVPFWHVKCSSHFDYNRHAEYTIDVSSVEAVEITIRRDHNRSITYPVDAKRMDGKVKLSGFERIVSNREHESWEDSYVHQQDLPLIQVDENKKRMKGYLIHSPREVDNLEEFGTASTIDGHPLFEDDVETIVVPPLDTAESIAQRAISNVMVAMDGPSVNQARLRLERIDLYFRPIYVIEFERFDRNGNRIDRKIEELDALSHKRWTTLERTDFQLAQIPWVKILKLSADVGAVLLQNYSGIGPALQITSKLLDQGPDILNSLSGSDH